VLAITILALLHLVFRFPLGDDRDWLNILSDLGQFFGVLTLVALVYDVFRREHDVRRRRTPRIEIVSADLVHELPDTCETCLCEAESRNLPDENELQTLDEYIRMYDLLDHRDPTTPRTYLRIKLINEQQNIEGQAKDLHLKIIVSYAATSNSKVSESRDFWCPHSAKEGIRIKNGRHETIYIRCGDLNRTGLDYIEGKVIGYECQNLRGDTFRSSSKMGFDSRVIPRQSLRREEEVDDPHVEHE
jgi:hypothetical protein